MKPQDVQNLINKSIQTQVPKMIFDTENKNYYSGNPKVPPHTHNGVDNLKISASNITGTVGQLPVGSLYFSTNLTNPATTLGYGTWSLYGQGRVPVNYGGSTDPNFSVMGSCTGETTHTLTTAEIPAHSHCSYEVNISGGSGSNWGYTCASSYSGYSNTFNTGGGGAHNNLQPSIVVAIWERTA